MKNTNNTIPDSVLDAYGLNDGKWQVIPFGSGLINHTWRLQQNDTAVIVQRINHQVFKKPHDIAHNIELLNEYLSKHHPGYLFVSAIPTLQGQAMSFAGGDGFYRVFPFVEGSHTIDVVHTAQQAFEAAQQFGRFTRLLNGVDVHQLRTTIPSFHDLTLRYQQFLTAMENGIRNRVQESQFLIKKIIHFSELVTRFESIRKNPAIHLRVIHHDTKISNVLFNNSQQAICVIDLDTVMPGYFISDVGDMMRTYLCPVSEEEKDTEKIFVREDFYRAIRNGYLGEMNDVLSDEERDAFFYAGQFIIYMQAIRFLTDYLQGDIYYGSAYPGHNFFRARNQLTLLESYTEKETSWK